MDNFSRLLTLPAAGLVGLLALAACTNKESTGSGAGRVYSPYANQPALPKADDTVGDKAMHVYFGDTHLHTSWSTDAGMVGATLGPDEAYRFSRGETVESQTAGPVKLIRPLDFLVVADHAENLGIADFIERSDPIILANRTGKRWHDMVKAGDGYDAYLEWLRAGAKDLINEPALAGAVWTKVVANADRYYEPGRFTTFHGFEWTSHPGGNNMHRVVIFRDGADRTSQVLPYSQYDSVNAEDLWAYLAGYEQKTGGRALAIPHNGNLSNGLMFDVQTYSGGPITAEYARARMRFERIVEVTQMKGDGETHPLLSPDDEFADFETFDKGNLDGSAAKSNNMLPAEYGRSALLRGLRFQHELGTNPFQFGMIGATDAHNALPTTREENNFSKAYIVEPAEHRYEHVLVKAPDPRLSMMAVDLASGALAAVWAPENTREAIWDAMARREVYATTGTRMRVRVFGGYGFADGAVDAEGFASSGGVPMGGELAVDGGGRAPTLMVRALKDPDGANLDRIQVVKGWVDAGGVTHERIFDVAVSGDRTIGADGRCREAVGSTVKVADASYTNTIGAPTLSAQWTDPTFNSAHAAFYYVRVLEIPTPRWTAFDAKFYGVEMPEGTTMVLQERAYTSPIWFTP